MTEGTKRRAPRTSLFVVLQLILIAGLVLWGRQRIAEQAGARALPSPRAEPLAISPLYDDPGVVGDDQLRRVLGRLGFRPQGAETQLGHVDHALRFWGPNVEFDDPGVMGGPQLLGVLTDHRQFVELYGAEREPLLIDDGRGVRVRFLEGPASASHQDHTLASLAEVGRRLDSPIVTPLRETELRAVLEQSLRDFSLNQVEYEWSSLAYALFLPPVSSWFTSEGQRTSFDRLAGRLMRERLPRGVCAGNHRLHALVAFLRVDDRMRRSEGAPILAPETRERIVGYLREATAKLVRNQHPDGFWDEEWPDHAPAPGEPAEGELGFRLIVTGHALEWWALSPAELHPPREVLVAAGQWLVRTVEGLSEDEIRQNFTYLSHVGRALALWRGLLPAEAVSGGQSSRPGEV